MLNYEKKQIEILLKENTQLTNEYNISSLNVKRDNLNFVLWVILAIVIFITGIKFVVYS